MNKSKRTKRVVSMLLAMVLCFSLNPVTAMAAEAEETMELTQTEGSVAEVSEEVYGGLYDVEENPLARAVRLSNCAIRMGYEDTYMHIEFLTGANYDATEIGVKDVKVQKKVGIFWTTVATSYGASVSDTAVFSGSCDCYSVVKGETYRVSCVHYAYINGVYYSLDNVTDGHAFN